MQTIGVSSFFKTDSTFFEITKSVSLNNVRRSECPIITCDARLSRNIDADISPVKAPLSSSLQFCAPIFIKSGKADFAEPKSVKGGHKMISFGFVRENVENSSRSFLDPFIFQLATKILCLFLLDIFNSFDIKLYGLSAATCLRNIWVDKFEARL